MPKITKSYIDRLKYNPQKPIVWDTELQGFGVRTYPPDEKGNSNKSFVLRYSRNAKERPIMVIGAYGPMTPTKAREEAQRLIVAIRDGADPLADKKAKRFAVSSGESTFGRIVEKYIELSARPDQRTWKETKRTLEVNCADWINRPIASITRAEAQDLIDGFLAKGQKAKARVTYIWLRALFKWAENREVVDRSIMEKVEVKIEPEVRERYYSDNEIKNIWNAANGLGSNESAFVKLVLLLGVRKSELAGMRRVEFDDPDNPTVWTIPHERVKVRKSARKKRIYIVPLPPLAQRIIKSLPKLDDDLIFPGRKKGQPIVPGTKIKQKIWARSGVEDWTYHACRDTVATWLENQGHSEYERGLVLNHSAFGVTAGYSHGYPTELKRELLEKWADHVAGIVQPQGVAVLS